jgi:F-type H+-transporting ATPase subunit epsilon
MNLELEILIPDGVAVRTRVTSLTAADGTGRFGLLPHHQTFLTLLSPCVLSFREERGDERYAAADGGVLLLEADRVSIVTREAVVADDLDEVADAVESMLEARRQDELAARNEFAGLRARLLRELSNIDLRERA